jgi:hypothetical protein
VFTSCFSRLKLLPVSVEAVAVSRGVPVWYQGRRELRLAPERSMLRVPEAEFDRYYSALLAKLDPRQVFDALGDNAVLLCWEPPGKPCHRLDVARWFHQHLGIVVREWHPKPPDDLEQPAQMPLFPELLAAPTRRRRRPGSKN